MRFATNFGRKTKAFIGLIVLVFSIFLLPIQSYAALEEIKNGTDISTLDIRKFNLNINNVSVLSKSQSVDQFHLSNPHYEYLSGGAYPGEMENFTLKVDKSKKQDQVFENPLSLKFINIGTVNGKQVDAYLNFNKVTLHYLNTAQAESEMNSAQKSTVEFFSISELWESNAFEIGNVPYVDANHDYIMNKAFWIDADVTAEIRYADGTETDLKLVMKPTDIDAIDANNLKETFYVKNYQNDVNLRLMNNANVLVQEEASDRTSWIATQITGGSYYENNVSGLALRSNSNSMNFGYSSTETCSAVFGLYIEKIDPRPVLEVDPAEIPAKDGQDVTYKATFKVPVPGKDILAAPSSIEMVQKFDERLDYKELKVESGGVTLQEGRDYTIEKTGQTVTVKMTPEYLKGNSSTDIIITYKTATNKKVEEKGSEKIDNTVTLHVDNLSAPSNQVSTALLYEKHHEFVSGTPGKELPQEVKDLLPATENNLSNGSQVTPTQPSKTEVKTSEGTWSFKSYDKPSETINGADAHFVGTWEFTPAPTYKATHEFVSGTPGKELPQEVKDLLPVAQTDLKDGSQATPTQPSKTEVKTTEGTWSFKSYDKTSETILDTEKVDGHSAKTAVYEFLKGLYDDLKPEEQSNHVLKGQVEELLTKAEELVNQVNEEGVKASLSDEVKNLKAALEKEDADLDELNTQVQDLLKLFALTIQNERDNSKQDPEVLVLYQKLYNGVIALHSYLEMNNGSDADFEKVDALFDKLSAASKDKQALLAVAQEIVLLNQELRFKATPSQETPVETKQETPGQVSPDEQVESSSVQTTTENTSETTTELNPESTEKVSD